MAVYRHTIMLLLLLTVTAGCLGTVEKLYPDEKEERTVTVYIIHLGWHAGIAFEGQYLRAKLPDHQRLPDTKYLMMGWGDNRYYPSDKAGIGLFMRAAFLPTGSVIQVVGYDEPTEFYFKNRDVLSVKVSVSGMKNMIEYIAKQFKKDAGGKPVFISDGHFPNSAFFKAKGIYIFPNTSNKWTARVLRESGFPITPFYAITSGNVMQQVRNSGGVALN